MPIADFGLLILVTIIIVSFGSGIIGGLGGPAGMPVLLMLFLLTPLSSTQIAGTAITVFASSVLFGAYLYLRTNQISWRILIAIVPASLVGTQIGIHLNTHLSKDLFGYILGIMVFIVAINIIYREMKGLEPKFTVNPRSLNGIVALSILGLIVGIFGGLLGIAGPALTVPALILLGVPTLTSIGTSLAQAVFITFASASSYLLQDAVVYSLVVIIGLPFLLGISFGWLAAHRVDTKLVNLAIAGMLLIFSPLLAFT